jgi:hypothetical protein
MLLYFAMMFSIDADLINRACEWTQSSIKQSYSSLSPLLIVLAKSSIVPGKQLRPRIDLGVSPCHSGFKAGSIETQCHCLTKQAKADELYRVVTPAVARIITPMSTHRAPTRTNDIAPTHTSLETSRYWLSSDAL